MPAAPTQSVDPADPVDPANPIGAGAGRRRDRHNGGGRDAGRVGTVVLLVVAAGLVVAPSLAYLAGRLRPGGVSDADHLMLAELLPSLATGSSVDDWTIPLANYLVPDWPLYGLALLIGPTPTLAVATFMALQMGLVALAIHAVARAVDRPSAGVVSVISLGLVTAFVARDVLPLTYLAAASTHAGTVILALFSLAATLRWLDRRCGPAGRAGAEPGIGVAGAAGAGAGDRVLLVGGVVAFAAVASDRLFVVWYLCPAATALGLLALARRLPWAQLIRWLGVHLAAAALALPVPSVLFPNPTPYSVSVRQGSFRLGLSQYRQSVEATLASSPTQTAAVAVAALVLGVTLARRRSLVGRALPETGAAFLVVHLAATVAWVSIGVASVGDGIAPHMRHYLILFVLPLALAPVVALSGLEPGSVRPGSDRRRAVTPILAAPILAIAALVPAVATLAGAATDLGRLETDHPTVPLDCIEAAATRFGSSHGVASYWDARPIEVFSQGRLQVATVSPALVEDPTNTDLSEFTGTYDFAVTSSHIPAWQLPLDRLVSLAGSPRHQQACGPFTVANWGPGGLDLHPVDEVGASVSLSACDLPSQLAEPVPPAGGDGSGGQGGRCLLAAPVDAPPGFLSYGPYIGLRPGRYRFSVEVRSTAGFQVPVADWDVIFDGNTDSPIDVGTVTGTDGRWDTVEVLVEVSDDAPGEDGTGEPPRVVVEVRLDPSAGPVELSRMTIERLS